MVVASLYLSLKNFAKTSAFLLALGAAIKLTPMAFILYYFFHRKWKELFYFYVFFSALFILIPALCFGWNDYFLMMKSWAFVLSDTLHFPFFKYTNQSPLVVFTHWMHATMITLPAKIFHYLMTGIAMLQIGFYFFKKNQVKFVISLFILMLTASPVVWMEYYLILMLTYMYLNFQFFKFQMEQIFVGTLFYSFDMDSTLGEIFNWRRGFGFSDLLRA